MEVIKFNDFMDGSFRYQENKQTPIETTIELIITLAAVIAFMNFVDIGGTAFIDTFRDLY